VSGRGHRRRRGRACRHSNDTAAQLAPAAFSLPSRTASFLAMVAQAYRQGLAAVKLLADIPDNAARQLSAYFSGSRQPPFAQCRGFNSRSSAL
jgi:hypothetical protein